MHKTLTALFAASATVLCLGAHADDATRQADKQANAQYSAAKKRADANEDLNKAKCGSSWTRAGRACKSDASAEAPGGVWVSTLHRRARGRWRRIVLISAPWSELSPCPGTP